MQVRPRPLPDTVHDSVSRVLTPHGLKEFGRDQNLDLVVRYPAEGNSQASYAGPDEWVRRGPREGSSYGASNPEIVGPNATDPTLAPP